jgi:hypothetical protein
VQHCRRGYNRTRWRPFALVGHGPEVAPGEARRFRRDTTQWCTTGWPVPTKTNCGAQGGTSAIGSVFYRYRIHPGGRHPCDPCFSRPACLPHWLAAFRVHPRNRKHRRRLRRRPHRQRNASAAPQPRPHREKPPADSISQALLRGSLARHLSGTLPRVLEELLCATKTTRRQCRSQRSRLVPVESREYRHDI